MQSYEVAGCKIPYNKGSAFQMLYEEHQAFISSGSSKTAQAFRKMEAGLLGQRKFIEAFQLNAQRVQAAYGHKYDEAIMESMKYYTEKVVPELQKQLQQKLAEQASNK